MAKRVSEIDLDPKRITKGEIWSLQQAGRGMRIQCPFCGQGWINVINYGPLKNILWCYECDSVFPSLVITINSSKLENIEIYGLVQKIEEMGLKASDCELTEGWIETFSEEYWKKRHEDAQK